MGLNFYTAREVLRCNTGSGLGDVVTIGRLQQFLLPKQTAALQAQFRLPNGGWMSTPFGDFADDFYAAAGARSVASIDMSSYEDATILHDMNQPIGAEWHGQFDLVVDGGSIEHVFRVDQALSNDMRLLRIGGHLVIWAPSNNQCGHGFYQFSPEFFFGALRPETGFEIQRVLLVECVYPSVSLVPPRRAFAVRNPMDVRSRVGALSRRPLMLLVHAVKRHHLDEPFSRLQPQQSDYAAQWVDEGRPLAAPKALMAAGAKLLNSRRGGVARNHALGCLERRRHSLGNGRFFRADGS